MIWLWIAAALISAALAVLIVQRAARAARRRRGDNPALAVYRRQMAELDELADRGVLADAERRSVRAETGRRLLAAAERAGSADRQLRTAGDPSDRGGRAADRCRSAIWRSVRRTSPTSRSRPGSPRGGRPTRRALEPPQMAAVFRVEAAEHPGDPRPLLKLALAEFASRQPSEAIQALHRAIALSPREPVLWQVLGQSLVAQSGGEADSDAIDAFRHVLALNPSNAGRPLLPGAGSHRRRRCERRPCRLAGARSRAAGERPASAAAGRRDPGGRRHRKAADDEPGGGERGRVAADPGHGRRPRRSAAGQPRRSRRLGAGWCAPTPCWARPIGATSALAVGPRAATPADPISWRSSSAAASAASPSRCPVRARRCRRPPDHRKSAPLMSLLPKSRTARRRLMTLSGRRAGAGAGRRRGALRHARLDLVLLHAVAGPAAHVPAGRSIQLGGLVRTGSVVKKPDGEVDFVVADNAAVSPVTFKGELPDLFREGQGVVAIGAYNADRRVRGHAGPGQARRELHAARAGRRAEEAGRMARRRRTAELRGQGAAQRR